MVRELRPVTISALDRVALSFDQLWQEMLGLGFHLDDYAFRLLTILEPPDSELKPIRSYFKEQIRERLTNQFWRGRIFSEPTGGYQSNYIDWLVEQNEVGRWASFGASPDVGDVSWQPSLNRKASFILSRQVDPLGSSGELMKDRINAIRDADAIWTINPSLKTLPFKMTRPNLRKILANVFAGSGFELDSVRSQKEYVTYSRKLADGETLIAACFDLYIGVKHAEWRLSLGLFGDDITKPFHFNSNIPINLALNDLFPAWNSMRRFRRTEERKLPSGAWITTVHVDEEHWCKLAAAFFSQAIISFGKRLDKELLA